MAERRPPRGRRALPVVDPTNGLCGTVVVVPWRADLSRAGLERAAAPERLPAVIGPSGPAWPHPSARTAAQRRWRGLHPRVRTVVAVRRDDRRPLAPADAVALVEAALERLATLGVRRVDLRLTEGHPLSGTSWPDGWFGAEVAGRHVLSREVAHPWNADPASPGRPACSERARRRQRTVRRLIGIAPVLLPGRVAALLEDRLQLRRRGRRATRLSTAEELSSVPSGTVAHAESRYRTVRRALELLAPDLLATAFLDIGSGSGRVLELAAERGFASVHGIEHDPALVALARRHVGERADVHQGDARTQPIDERVGVVLLNNPFDRPTVDRFAEHLTASLDDHPRPLVVLYLNAPSLEPFLARGFRTVHVDALLAVLLHQPPAPGFRPAQAPEVPWPPPIQRPPGAPPTHV